MFIFPFGYPDHNQVDEGYEGEAIAASLSSQVETVGPFEYIGQPQAVNGVLGSGWATYRGWMMPVATYAKFYGNLKENGIRLVSDAAQYSITHYMNMWYPFLIGLTPRTTFIMDEGIPSDELITSKLKDMKGADKLFIKSLVKSDGFNVDTDFHLDAVKASMQRYLDFYDDTNGGWAIREWVPMRAEIRAWVAGANTLYQTREGNRTEPEWMESPPAGVVSLVNRVKKKIHSHFYTVDVAYTKGNVPIVVELGDGQVSGLPESLDSTPLINACELLMDSLAQLDEMQKAEVMAARLEQAKKLGLDKPAGIV